MELMERRKEIVGSAFVFAVFLTTLTALRVWNLKPSTSVQSDIVKGTAILVVAAVAYYVYCGGNFLNGWIIALGPVLAFTLNLFAPVTTMGVVDILIWGLGSAIPISGVLAIVGLLLGEGLKRVTKPERKNRPT